VLLRALRDVMEAEVTELCGAGYGERGGGSSHGPQWLARAWFRDASWKRVASDPEGA